MAFNSLVNELFRTDFQGPIEYDAIPSLHLYLQLLLYVYTLALQFSLLFVLVQGDPSMWNLPNSSVKMLSLF